MGGREDPLANAPSPAVLPAAGSHQLRKGLEMNVKQIRPAEEKLAGEAAFHLPTSARTHTPPVHEKVLHAHSPFSCQLLPVHLKSWFYNRETQFLPLQFKKREMKRHVEGHLQGIVGMRKVPFFSVPGTEKGPPFLAGSPPSSGLRADR